MFSARSIKRTFIRGRARNLVSLLAAGLVCASGSGQSALAASPTPQMWFGMPAISTSDGLASWNRIFFDPGKAWPQYLNYVQVIQADANSVNSLSARQLTTIGQQLKQHDISFALGVLAQNWVGEPKCGYHVEGHSGWPGNAKLADKLLQSGTHVSYLVMDEPMYFGHYYNGANACHSSIANIAERVATNIKQYQGKFPDLIIFEGEPFPGVSTQPNWQQTYQNWMSAFQNQVGRPISGLIIDIGWGDNRWQNTLSSVVNLIRGHNIRVGIIYNAAGNAAANNNQWVQKSAENLTLITRNMAIRPDIALFCSWVKFPERSITDQNGLGEDYLVKEYLRDLNT
jgi:hypothetical protein